VPAREPPLLHHDHLASDRTEHLKVRIGERREQSRIHRLARTRALRRDLERIQMNKIENIVPRPQRLHPARVASDDRSRVIRHHIQRARFSRWFRHLTN
jgi:hypothetical protein